MRARLRKLRLPVAGAAGCLVVAALASAYFTGSGSGDATASVGALTAPTISQATASAGTVALAWTTATPAGATYFVSRDGAAAGGNCARLGAPAPATTCTDSGMTAGSHSYTVTAVWRSWTKTSAAVTVVVPAAPSVALSPTSGAVGDTIALSGSDFPAGSPLSATFDGSPLALSPPTSTDGSGAFSGVSFAVPASTAGVHSVAVAAGAGSASAGFTVAPTIAVSPASGVAGSTATISGSGFGAATTLTATLGGSPVTLTGTTTTGANGSFAGATFTVPNLPAGALTLSVSDSAVNGAVTTFAIPTPSLTLSPSTGVVGGTLEASGSGFPAGSSVSVTYDGAVLTIPSTTTSSSGSFSGATFTVPASTAAAHTVQATAATRSATASFTVSPSITVSVSTGVVGDAVTVSGFGFPASSAVSATYDGAALTISATSTDASGSFSGATFTVPASTAGAHAVAFTAGSGSASGAFTVAPSVAVSTASGVAGSTATISGAGFAGGSTITATLGGSPVSLGGTTTTGANGSFSGATFTVPNQAAGAKTLAVADVSLNTASTSFTIPTPSLSLSPTAGLVGDTVTISGSGFPAGSSVTATYDGASLTIPATSTSAAGSFSGATFTVPASTAGAHTVQATAATRSASSSFTVSPKITLSPATGSVGDTIAVSGSGFPASSALSATYGGAPLTVSAASTGTAGSFSGVTFTVPASTSGAHTVAFTGGSSSATAALTVTPEITLTPASGAGGSAAAVAGTGFGASKAITGKFNGSSLTLGGTTTTDAAGSFASASYTVPNIGSGTYAVQVTDAAANTATASFTIGGTSTARATGNWSLASTWQGIAKTGTITTVLSSTGVTGIGTLFLTQLAVGDAIYKSDGTTLIGTVAAIASNTSLTLAAGAASANVAISYAAGRVPAAADDVVIAGAFTVTIPSAYNAVAKSMTLGSAANTTVQTLAFATATSTLTVSGDLTINAPSGTATRDLPVNAGSLTVGGDVKLSAGATSNSATRVNKVTITTGTVSIAGNLVFNAANFTSANAANSQVVVTGAGTVNLTGAFTINGGTGTPSGTLSPGTASTFNFNGTAAQAIPIGVSSVVYCNLHLNNTSASGATLSAAVTATNVTGNLRVLSGTLGNGGFAVAGNAAKTFEVAAGATYKLTGTSSFPTGFASSLAATSTVDYAGAAQTVSGTPAYGNLSVSGGNTKTAGAGLAVNGSLSIGSGTTLAASTFTHTLKGAFTNNGAFTAGTSTTSLSGSSAQTIGGSTATTFNNLTVGNAVSLSGVDATVSGTLALGGNVLSTGSGKLVANGTVTRTSGFVDGRLQKPVAVGASTLLFEIGAGTTYAPIGLTVTGASANGTLTASTTTGQHPSFGTSGLSATKYVNRYWTLTAGGGLTVTTCDAAFTFVAGDLVGAPNTSTLQVRRYSGGTWSAPLASSSTATTVTGTGFSAFGDFAAGN